MRKKNKPVAVLGCGPSGLLAAHAAWRAGKSVEIFSMAKRSRIGGAQYLHREIPGLTPKDPDTRITHVVRGNAATYQHKAYGNGAQPEFVSFDRVIDEQAVPAWDLRMAYEELWDFFHEKITNIRVNGKWLQANAGRFSLVISSIPMFSLCHNYMTDNVVSLASRPRHTFAKQTIQILNKCLPGGPHGDNNVIYYDGTPDVSWYRASMILGTGSTEWGGHVKLPFPEHDIVKVYKPVATNCDCWGRKQGVLHVGRFGRWKKGVLTHHAFEEVAEAMN